MQRPYAETGPIALYRMFSASGELLYIGQSINPAQRLCLHRNDADKNWLIDVVRMDLEWFSTRAAAKSAEAAAILAESPLHNVDHHPEQTARRRARRVSRMEAA